MMKSFFSLLPLLVVFITPTLHTHSNHKIKDRPVVFAHVAVIDAAGGSVQQDMTVVIVGDHIAEVGKAAAVKIPRTAQLIDGRGKFLMPGLWDMHIHTFGHNPRSTRSWYFPLLVANGVTGVRDMWTTGDEFPQVAQWRKGLAEGSFLGPRFGAVGWLVDGPAPVHPGSDVVSTPQEARDFVRRAKAAGVDFVKVYTKLQPEEYFAIADEAKKAGIPFEGHVPDAVRAAAASDAGQRTMEHLRNINIACSSKEEELMQATWGPQQRKEMFETYDHQKCERLVERFARNQTWQVPTAVLFWGEHSMTDPRMKYVTSEFREKWRRLPVRPVDTQAHHMGLTVVGMMNKAGVPMMAGTDLANPFIYPGFSLHDELALFVEDGLTPGEALKTATYNPAKFLGILDRLGTVEKGKVADLVLIDANPLEDIHNTQKIRAVVMNGRYLDRPALDKLLADAAAAAR